MENFGPLLVLLAISFVLAFLVESFTEYLFGVPFEQSPKLKPYKWTLVYVAMALGIFLALYFKLDLIALVAAAVALLAGVTFSWPASVVGMVLTGMILGRGSNFLHDFLGRFLKRPTLDDFLTE